MQIKKQIDMDKWVFNVKNLPDGSPARPAIVVVDCGELIVVVSVDGLTIVEDAAEL